MKVFNRISSLCHTFSFWGIVFLACFVGVLNVKFQDIFTIALNGPIELQIICIYMLLSIPVFILLVVMHYVKNMIPAIEVFIINFQTTICTPYKGFDFSECFKFKKLGMDRSMIISDLKVLFRRFFQTIIWWTIVGFSIYNIINIPANPIKTAIEAIPTSEFYIRIASIVGIIVLLNIIAWVMFKIMTKRWRNEDIRAEKKNICKKNNRHQYYDRNLNRIPAGCRACGGPYPDCRTSCNIFDD